MYKPLVAVVGRPNVGKSTLFNAIVKKRISIVEDIPGVTRDRIYFDAEWLGQEFTMIDTGGIEFVDSDNHIFTSMRYQAELAIREADVILYVVDGKVGVQPQDLLCRGDIIFSFRRQRDRRCGSVKNGDIIIALHFLHHGAERRLRDEQPLSRLGKALFLIDGVDIPHFLEHLSLPPRCYLLT